MTQILDGKKLARILLEEITDEVKEFTRKGFPQPGLGIITAGNDPAGQVYIKNKLKKAEKAGFKTFHEHVAAKEEKKLKQIIRHFNQNPEINGYIIQLPLPGNFKENEIIEMIDPGKDADGFHPLNLGKILSETSIVFPATPFGIMELFKHYRIQTAGKHVVIAGRSLIVGKPLAMMLAAKNNPGNAAVTLIHSRIKNPEFYTKQTDIFISAVGKPKIWKKEHFKPGTIFIDVGINYDEQGRLCGDIDYEDVFEMAGSITPVPGGVGPMTVVMLLKNTLQLYKKQLKL